MFKCYGVQGISAGLYFIQDLKLGHYMKVSPRVTFSGQSIAIVLRSPRSLTPISRFFPVQILSSLLAAFAQAAMKEGLLHAVPDLCSDVQASRLICPTAKSVFNASIIW